MLDARFRQHRHTERLVVYFGYNLDKVLLGRVWGANALGIYGRAYQIINIPTANLNAAIGSVAFSALSRLQLDPPRYRRYFLKSYSLVTSLTIRIAIFSALYANDIILVALGEKWTASAPFRLLAPTVLVFGLINPMGWLLFSLRTSGTQSNFGIDHRTARPGSLFRRVAVWADRRGICLFNRSLDMAHSAFVWCVHGTPVTPKISRRGRSSLIAGVAAGAFGWGAHPWITDFSLPIVRLVLAAGVTSCRTTACCCSCWDKGQCISISRESCWLRRVQHQELLGPQICK